MNFEKYNTQQFAGMGIDTLQAHYAEVKEQYLQLSGKDTRTQAYLSVVDGWIQKLQNEPKEEAE